MGEPIMGDGTPPADRIEITNFVQDGPARLTRQFGTRLDYTNAGRMMFLVEVVDVEGARLVLDLHPSYEAAIIVAEEAAPDWAVPVDDLVSA